MKRGVSVCVPAHNEERTVSKTLDSILSQNVSNDLQIEVLVCENGSSDRTADVVNEYVRKYSNVGLIKLSKSGKANAWNVLRGEALNDSLVFCDADVVLESSAVGNLYSYLNNSDLVLVGGKMVPYFEDLSFLNRFLLKLANPERYQFWFSGQLYSFNNEKLNERMKKNGFTQMPEVIADDIWLPLVCGDGNWGIEERAFAYYRPCSISEMKDVQSRHIRASLQIRAEFPGLIMESDYLEGKGLFKMLKYFMLTRGFLNKAGFVTRLPFVYCARKKAVYELGDKSLKPDIWEVSTSSKIPMPSIYR